MRVLINGFGTEVILKEELSLDLTLPTLKEVLRELRSHPGRRWERFVKEDLSLTEGSVVLVNGRNVASLNGLETKINDGDEITLTVLVAGG
jgi:molybdopterin converting factor small subunit